MLRFIGTLAMAWLFAWAALGMAQQFEEIHSDHMAKIEQATGL